MNRTVFERQVCVCARVYVCDMCTYGALRSKCAYSQGQLEFQEERVLSSGAITGFVSTVECDVPGRAPVTVFRAPPQGPTFAKLPWLQCNPRPDSRGRMVADADGRPVPEVPLPARQRKRRCRPRMCTRAGEMFDYAGVSTEERQAEPRLQRRNNRRQLQRGTHTVQTQARALLERDHDGEFYGKVHVEAAWK